MRPVWEDATALHVRAPGRVNLLGEHVDTNQGVVLPAAIDRYVDLYARPVNEGIVRITALDYRETVFFSLDELDHKIDLEGQALPGWALYPAGVAYTLMKSGLVVQGIEAGFRSNIPIGAGLSSSAAIEIAFALLWQTLGGWDIPRLQLAQLCQQAENEYAGVPCGLMDQFTSACGVVDHILRFDTRSLDYRAVPFPAGYSLVIADSGLRRSLRATGYNVRLAECRRAIQLLQQEIPGITSLRDLSPADFYRLRRLLPPPFDRRVQHVVEEMMRVENAETALEEGDMAALGELLNAGHASLRDLYEVSMPQIDLLVQIAQNLPGCLGARLTGGGFGGCTINLVQTEMVQTFCKVLADLYNNQTGIATQVFACRPSGGVKIVP
jgi:galactokinase